MNILSYQQFCEKKKNKKRKKKKVENEETFIRPIKKPANFWDLAGVV